MALDHKSFSLEIKAVNDDGFFSGYASVFGVVDSHGDIVAKGAFSASLEAWGAKKRLPSLLWHHKLDEPIGVWTVMREDDVGLYVEGRLTQKVQRAAEVYELMKIGAVSGLSIGYVTREDSYDRVTDVRTLKQVDLWEVSPVTMPSNEQARLTGIKSRESAATKNAIQALINSMRS